MVEFTDGHGKKDTQMATVVPGVGTCFIPKQFLSKPVQKWLEKAISEKTGG